MKNSIYCFLFLLGLVYSNSTSSQIIFREFSPNEIIDMPSNTDNTILFDIDNDASNDLMFRYYNYPGSIMDLGIDQIDATNPKIETIYDAIKPKSPIGTFYVDRLKLNDLIASTSTYSDDFPIIGDIYDPNFLGETDKYIGFRLIVGTNQFKYGWMLVEFTGSSDLKFTIKELAYQSKNNTSIKVGEKSTVGIHENSLDQLGYRVTVDPINDVLNLKNFKNSKPNSVCIYSTQGQRVFENVNPSLPLEIDISSFGNRAFILIVTEEGRNYSYKFLKM